jgi:glycosyltransferase involved in cell wall biosynthesis
MLGDIPNIEQSPRERFELRINYSMLKKSNLIIAVSESTANTIRQYLPTVPVDVLPLTVTKVSREISREHLEDVRTFGQFCLLPMNSHWRKNRIEGIQAWSEIRKVSPEKDLHLVIIGNQLDGQESEFLKESGDLAQLHIRSNVPEEYLSFLYQECEFVVFTSRYEGFGLPIIESNSHGKLTLHSDLGILNEIAGPYNVKLQRSLQDNDWFTVWENLCSGERRLKALNYYNDTYSNIRFEASLKNILRNAMNSVKK